MWPVISVSSANGISKQAIPVLSVITDLGFLAVRFEGHTHAGGIQIQLLVLGSGQGPLPLRPIDLKIEIVGVLHLDADSGVNSRKPLRISLR